jgi:putative FmdB family regulatory protein
MPLNEYRCNACGAVFERAVPHYAAGYTFACPVCKSRDTQAQVPAGALVAAFSGSGDPRPTSTCGSDGYYT